MPWRGEADGVERLADAQQALDEVAGHGDGGCGAQCRATASRAGASREGDGGVEGSKAEGPGGCAHETDERHAVESTERRSRPEQSRTNTRVRTTSTAIDAT